MEQRRHPDVFPARARSDQIQPFGHQQKRGLRDSVYRKDRTRDHAKADVHSIIGS